MSTHDDEPVLRHSAYRNCLLCSVVIPFATSGHLRRHYHVFHLATKESGIAMLIRMAEDAAKIPEEDRR